MLVPHVVKQMILNHPHYVMIGTFPVATSCTKVQIMRLRPSLAGIKAAQAHHDEEKRYQAKVRAKVKPETRWLVKIEYHC